MTTIQELEQWLKDNAPEEWFSGYDVAEGALKALRNYRNDIAVRDKMLAMWAAQPNQQQLIDSQAAQLVAARAQVAQLSVKVEQLRKAQAEEVDEMNAGYAAAVEGESIDDEPSGLHHDVWRIGWVWGKYCIEH